MGPVWQLTGELSSLVYRLFPVRKVCMDLFQKGADFYRCLRYLLPHPAVLPPVEWLHSAVETLRGGPYITTCRIHHYDYQGRWPWPTAGCLEVVVCFPHGQQ